MVIRRAYFSNTFQCQSHIKKQETCSRAACSRVITSLFFDERESWQSLQSNQGMMAYSQAQIVTKAPFEGFGARDTRKYSEVASKVTLFRCSTLIKKARHVRHNSSLSLSVSLSSDEDVSERPNISMLGKAVEVSPLRKETSSTSSVEGEIATTSCASNSRFRASVANSTTSFHDVDSSSSSLEGGNKLLSFLAQSL